MNGPAPELATVGEVMGLLLAPDHLPLDRATTMQASYAGAEATVAVGLARLGHRVHLTARLGDDGFGRRIRRELRGEGVDIASISEDPDRPTGLLLRDATANRPVSVEYRRAGSAASALSPDDLDPTAIGSARVLHLTGITGALSASAFDTVVRAAEVARTAGVTVCLDPNVRRRLASPARWAEILERLAPLADIVLTGADDAAVVTTDDPAAWFLDRGAHTVVVKDGARGSWESGPDGYHRQPAFDVVAADPVGAGDAFAAGWLSAYLSGGAPAERLRTGAAVAACAVAVTGDVTGLPDARTLDAILHQHADVAR